MDLYRALNADVPQLLLTVMHQPRPTISREDYQRMMFILHEDMREQFQVIEHELDRWLKKHYIEEAEETVRKLQRLASLSERADVEQVQEVLIRDYSRLGSKVAGVWRRGDERGDAQRSGPCQQRCCRSETFSIDRFSTVGWRFA